MDYLPKRFLGHASFEAQEDSRHILDFKAGRRYAVELASKRIGKALSLMDLKDTIIVCIPASSCVPLVASGKAERSADLHTSFPQVFSQCMCYDRCHQRL